MRPASAQASEVLPLVTVIVLNLNGDKVIEKCIEHLLRQTYPNYEIIVIDNNSSDKSLDVLEQYLTTARVTVIKSTFNRGCPGGRNLGMQYASGEFVAFIDNDGYAEPSWLEEALRPFLHDSTVGAVASVVFFDRHKIILNGAGGTINRQGYAGDHCFNEPYEFAHIPDEVLYPMGCGMLVRKVTLDQIGVWDTALPNYYDDTELGIRIWKSGYRVVVAPHAWVDHELSYSTQFLPNKSCLVEKGRIRTVLKYYPIDRIGQWLWQEARHIWGHRPHRHLVIKAWLWNLAHISSALAWRLEFRSRFDDFERLVTPSWGEFLNSAPAHELYSPNLNCLGQNLSPGENPNAQLNYGWQWVEKDGTVSYRWTAAQASAYFRIRQPSQYLSITLCASQEGQRVRVMLRYLGEVEPTWETTIADLMPHWQWQTRDIPCNLDTGDYEMLLLPEKTFLDPSFRTLGLAVALIEFT